MRMEEIEEFDHETVPCYKCPKCKWIFALAVHIPQDLYDELLKTIIQFRLKENNREALVT